VKFAPLVTAITVTAYVVCAGSGWEVTEPTRDYATAKADCIRLRGEAPCEFYHIEDRAMQVEVKQ